MVIRRKYNTSTASGTHIRIPIPKAASTDFAGSGDWTPASGDVKLSKDGGTQANIGTLPTYTNGAWEFQLTGTELSCKQLEIMIVDSATKVITDQAILIETFGNASAMYAIDYSAAQLPANVTQFGGSAGTFASGVPEVKTASLASGAITATAIASDAITAAKLASDVGAEIADAVWDELTSGHTTTGTTGKALTDAGAAGTPPTATDIADAVMTRASSHWEASAPAKSLGTGVMKLTHKVESASGTLTIYRSDGTTVHVTQVETNDAAADPIVGLGGAS